MSRIVVLDGYTLNPGDLSWDALRACGACTIHDRTPFDQVVARASGALAVLTNKTVLNAQALEALPDLRYIGVLATGHNVVDSASAGRLGMTVTNVPGYSTASVAQVVFALILELTHHAGDHSRSVHSGRWAASADFAFWDTPLVELAGLTLGIVGYGAIGHAVATIARAFGMNVMVHTRSPQVGGQNPVQFVSLDELLGQADVVSLHCPLTPATNGLMNAARLAKMKRSAFLINTARGPLVDEGALAAALEAGAIAGAGLDVLTTEPPRDGTPLIGAPNCVITPHFAWASQAARKRLMTTAIENLLGFLSGQPKNVINCATLKNPRT